MKLSLAFVLLVCIAGAAEERKEVAADSYDVYSAVLTQHYRSWFKQNDPVLIAQHTVLEPQGHGGGGCRAQAERNAIVRGLLDRLLAEKQEFGIAAKLRLPGPYKISTGKARIREYHEPGIVFFSAVQFSEDRSKAMVLVGHSCGSLCGDGQVWILDKRDGGWHLSNDQLNCGWIR